MPTFIQYIIVIVILVQIAEGVGVYCTDMNLKYCCFCVPRRCGILIWAYFMQVLNIGFIGYFVIYRYYLKEYLVSFYAIPSLVGILVLNLAANLSFMLGFNKVVSIIALAVYTAYTPVVCYLSSYTFLYDLQKTMDSVMSIIFFKVLIIGVHKKRMKLMKVYYNYATVFTTSQSAVAILTGYIMFDTTPPVDNLHHKWLLFVDLGISVIIYILLQGYMVIVIKWELEKMNNIKLVRKESDAPEFYELQIKSSSPTEESDAYNIAPRFATVRTSFCGNFIRN